MHILWNRGHPGSERPPGQALDGKTTESHATRIRAKASGGGANQARLACTVATQQAHHFAQTHLEAHSIQNVPAAQARGDGFEAKRFGFRRDLCGCVVHRPTPLIESRPPVSSSVAGPDEAKEGRPARPATP